MADDAGLKHGLYRRPVAAAPSRGGQVIRLVPTYHWCFALLPSGRSSLKAWVSDPAGRVVDSVDIFPGEMHSDSRRRIHLTRLPPAVEHEIGIGTEQRRHAPRLRITLDSLGAAFADGDASAIARTITILPPDEE